MTDTFSTSFAVRWSDLDANGHMANTAYMEYAIQSRFLCFQTRGFSPKILQDLMLGPVVFRDETRYLKELRFLDEFVAVNSLHHQLNCIVSCALC